MLLTTELPTLSTPVERRLESVEARLKEAVSHADPVVDEPARHLAEAGGKRLRPLLALLTAHLGPHPETDEVVDAAVVVELTHLATLYHDDVMDEAPTRRGAPTTHTVWGNSVAILTGDVLFARASLIGAGLGPEAISIQARTFERLCVGQLRETVGPSGDDDPIEHYLGVLSDKTGSLVATSARFGAMFGGADESDIAAVERYGEKVGVAFQLADDVIDVRSTGSQTGKTPGTDLREGVPTMPVLLLRDLVASGEGTETDAALLAAIDGDLEDDAVLADVVARLREHDVVERTEQLARAWADDAVAAIDGLADGEVKSGLVEFARLMVERDS